MRTTNLGANRPQFSKPHLRGDDCRLLATSLSLRGYIVVKGGDDGESSTQCRSFLTSVFGAVSPESKESTPAKLRSVNRGRFLPIRPSSFLTTHHGTTRFHCPTAARMKAGREGEEIGTGGMWAREKGLTGSAKRQAHRIGTNGIEARRSTTWWKWYNELARQGTARDETGQIVKSNEGAASSRTRLTGEMCHNMPNGAAMLREMKLLGIT
ncbi:hypothetical protein EDB85DRAFT_1889895 [Lactarius pseudohatsudake]|nr:hypothetical protein EDB85DRAFT_1889895 [Lactarius pseudohatsudake]